MKFSKLTLAIATLLSVGASSGAFAIDLYVDTKTKQIFAEPGKGRQKLGTFEQVDDSKSTPQAATVTPASTAELDSIKQDLELKTNELKAIEEHIVANREDKAKNDEKWFNKINVRGYTQMRYNQSLTGDRVAGDPELRSPGDSGIKDNSNFTFRRVRLVFSGDVTDYVYIYLQPDFASTSGDLNFAQLRDAYADLAFDKPHEYRIRAGQSKVPFGWENLQSSQNRIALDRDDALNSAVPSERDLGLFAYWTPTDVQKLWKSMSKKGLKTSGDYGIVGVGVYNGQGTNKVERNDDMYIVAHTTYPFDLAFMGLRGQILEVGADAISGQFNTTTSSYLLNGVSKSIPTASIDGNSEDRVAVHAILFPQPLGLQAEWNWGKGPTLNTTTNAIERKSLNGGYVQAMYKIDNVFGTNGTIFPYAKWQTYNGAWKGAANSPLVSVEEVEAGIEYQINKALEIVLAYATMNRTNIADTTKSDYLKQASGDMIRTQLQFNY
ncbi:OprO/OprP family phosphate-selective porin [Methylosoma difficile]